MATTPRYIPAGFRGATACPQTVGEAGSTPSFLSFLLSVVLQSTGHPLPIK